MKWTIPEIVRRKNISIVQFSEMTGLSYVTAQRLCTGTSTRVDLETIAVVCKALNVKPGDLFEIVKNE